jgi:hypothetical protein
MIGVMGSQLSAASTLARLRTQKNKFMRPNFKKLPELPVGSEETVKIMGTEFERLKGGNVGQIVAKIKAESKAWQRVVDSVLVLSKKGSKPQQNGEKVEEPQEKGNLGEKTAKKRISKEDLDQMIAKAKESEIALRKRHQAAIEIQTVARKMLAIRRVERIRLEKRSAILVQNFLRRLIRRRKHCERVLETFKEHYYASILQRFMRECTQKFAEERKTREQQQLIRALFDGVKARMIFKLPRLLEIRQTILELASQLNDADVSASEVHRLNDDLYYHKNLYLNLFSKFWTKRANLQEEIQRENDRIKKKRQAPRPGSPPIAQERQSSRRSPSAKDVGRSRISSRQPSVEVTADDIRSSTLGGNALNPDDRPIKPMKQNFGSGLPGSETENGRSTNNSKRRQRKEPKKSVDNKEVSDKVLKQRELMDRRRKYDPRKVLDTDSKQESGGKAMHSRDKKVKEDPNKSLDHIAENPSEDKSGYLGLDEHGGLDQSGNLRPKKDFLKRKSKKVEFKKLDWSNVQRRIDCWVPKENIPEKKDPIKLYQSKASPRALGSFGSPQPSRDLNMIKLKGEETKKKEQIRKAREDKKEKDIMHQIEETLNGSYLPKLNEVFTKEISMNKDSKIPVLKNESRFILYIEENDLKDVLEELEEEYEFLVNL